MPRPIPRLSRLLTAVAAVLLLGALAFPLWRIDLEAPQYPEGLGMVIRINTIVGAEEHDLDNINELNHYIGMKAIAPDMITELRVMPWAVAGLAAAGLAAAARGRRAGLVAWLAAFGAAGVAGLVDFWRWGYEYGHDLAPDAIIKIPGMVYQPPVIGSKQLLNFVAHSWPGAGGVLAALAFLLGVAALVVAARAGAAKRAAAGTLLLAAAGCASAEARTIDYGAEPCAYCRMTVSDARFGAQVVTARGRVHVFDSAECAASYVQAGDTAGARVWVGDYNQPGTLVPVDGAEFRRLTGPAGSPMGKGLVATRRGEAPRGAATAGDAPMAWRDVLALVRREGMAAEAAHAH
jgi:copper chaperone NosL